MYTCLATGPIGVKVPFERACLMAANYGFEGISIGAQEIEEVGLEGVKALLAGHGLIAGNSSMTVNFREDEATFERDLAALPAYAEQMAALGCTRLITWLKPWHETLTYTQHFEQLRGRTARICEVLLPYGIRYGLEFVGPETSRRGHPNPFIHDIDGLLELLAAVDKPNFGFLLDAWHWYTTGDTAEDLAKLSDELVIAVHVNDAPLDIPRSEQLDNVREMPGASGVIPMDVFMSALVDMAYQGPVIVEPFSQWLRELPAEEAVLATAQSLAQIWPK